MAAGRRRHYRHYYWNTRSLARPLSRLWGQRDPDVSQLRNFAIPINPIVKQFTWFLVEKPELRSRLMADIVSARLLIIKMITATHILLMSCLCYSCRTSDVYCRNSNKLSWTADCHYELYGRYDNKINQTLQKWYSQEYYLHNIMLNNMLTST